MSENPNLQLAERPATFMPEFQELPVDQMTPSGAWGEIRDERAVAAPHPGRVKRFGQWLAAKLFDQEERITYTEYNASTLERPPLMPVIAVEERKGQHAAENDDTHLIHGSNVIGVFSGAGPRNTPATKVASEAARDAAAEFFDNQPEPTTTSEAKEQYVAAMRHMRHAVGEVAGTSGAFVTVELARIITLHGRRYVASMSAGNGRSFLLKGKTASNSDEANKAIPLSDEQSTDTPRHPGVFSLITNYLSPRTPKGEDDFRVQPVEPGDRIMVATKGLYGVDHRALTHNGRRQRPQHVSQQEVQSVYQEYQDADSEDLASKLADRSRTRGNTTVIVAEVLPVPVAKSRIEALADRRRHKKRVTTAVGAAVIAGAAVLSSFLLMDRSAPQERADVEPRATATKNPARAAKAAPRVSEETSANGNALTITKDARGNITNIAVTMGEGGNPYHMAVDANIAAGNKDVTQDEVSEDNPFMHGELASKANSLNSATINYSVANGEPKISSTKFQ